MPTTSNFGWTTPADTDLVKDGALAIRTLGNGIDTSMAQLKGGTTGQVLSKTSNTDMAFTWVTQDDANAIQNAIVDAKGDLIAATANDTPARLAVGNNGETLVADSSTSTGLRWQGNYAAGKNAIINGDFRIAQRGTSFSNPTSTQYTLDRWRYGAVVANPVAMTISQQTFTPGTAPVAGYEGANFLRMDLTTIGVGQTGSRIETRLEDCRLFAGQTATLSFWAKSDSNRTNAVVLQRNFGSGGSSAETILSSTSFSTTTAWTRFTFTFSVSSISGKTIGTSSFIEVFISQAVASGCVLDIWGVQLEAGSVATPFSTATGTLAGELAACQRYYFRRSGTTNQMVSTSAVAYSSVYSMAFIQPPVPMRVTPTSLDISNVSYIQYDEAATALNTFILNSGRSSESQVYLYASATGLTAGRFGTWAINNTTGHLGLSAEL